MRKPKQPGTKQAATEKPPPGGRAWERVKQFALERGLPLPGKPSESEAARGTEATIKRTAKIVTNKSGKGVKKGKRN